MGQGHIGVHSAAEQGYRGKTCGRTLAATTGTPCYRLQTAAEVVTVVRTLLRHGGPLQASVAAFGVDERTVANWLAHARQPSQQGQQQLVPQGRVDLP